MEQGRLEAYNDVVSGLYGAAVDQSLWPGVLKSLTEYFESDGIDLLTLDHLSGLVPFSQNYNIPDEAIELYDSELVLMDPRAAHTINNPNIKLVYDQQYITDREMDQSEFFNIFKEKTGFRYTLAAIISRPGISSTIFSFQRSPKTGHATKELVERLALLYPHMERCIQLSERLGNLASQKSTAEETLNRIPYGVVTVDKKGAICFMNSLATEIVSENDGLSDKLQRLHADNLDDDQQLQVLMGNTRTNTTPQGSGGGLTIRRPSGKRSYSILVAPLKPEEFCYFASQRPETVIFITDPEREQKPVHELLCSLYGLTNKEAQLTSLLVVGSTVSQAADVMSITKGTARLHLERIFRKTGVNRQSQLIMLILKSPISLS